MNEKKKKHVNINLLALKKEEKERKIEREINSILNNIDCIIFTMKSRQNWSKNK